MARKAAPATIAATPAGSPGKGIANLDAQLRAEADALKTQIGQPGGSQIKAKGGKFEYKMSCIHDTSGDEIMNTVVAAKDADAMKLAKGKCP